MSLVTELKRPATTISIAALVMACGGGAFAAGRASAPVLRTVQVSSQDGIAVCPVGFKVTGGGFVDGDKQNPATVTQSYPGQYSPTQQAWVINANGAVSTYAVCSAVR